MDLEKKILLEIVKKNLFSIVVIAIFFGFFSFVVAAPDGPSATTLQANETSTANSAYTLNISGGRIATVNLTASTQNSRWKAFVGAVSGTFTLDDASGATIYDWSLTTISGEVYATRNSTTPTWTNVSCASLQTLEQENTYLSHTNADDNITATFNTTTNSTHGEFFVGNINISLNSCPTLNTYQNNATQDNFFEEVALFSATGNQTIYATIIETDANGFDNISYDFQMIVPESGDPTFTGQTAYFLYVELT